MVVVKDNIDATMMSKVVFGNVNSHNKLLSISITEDCRALTAIPPP